MTNTHSFRRRPRLNALVAGLLLAAAGGAQAAVDLSSGIYHVDLSTADLNSIQALLPETKVNTSFVNSAIDPNLHLLKDAEISVTFISEGAGYKNSFGYFLFDEELNILSTQTIFANASAAGSGGSLKAGDTINLGAFDAGTNIGFWLKADGYANKNGYTYYTIDQFNPDGVRHVAIIADVVNERLVLGVEDLYKLGDQDYNDIVFTFAATPFSAIDIGGMPTGAPEAGPIATALICASLFGAYVRRQRRRQADDHGDDRNPS